MKKIAFLSHLDFNLYRFRLPVMKELVQLGHEVYAVCPNGNYSSNFQNFNVKHVPYRLNRKGTNPFQETALIYNLYNLFCIIKPDIVHTFTIKPNIYGSISGFFSDVPVMINSVTGLGSMYINDTDKLAQKIKRSFINNLYRMATRKSDFIIFQNKDDKLFFENRKIVTDSKAVLIPGSGVDTEVFTPPYNINARMYYRRNILGCSNEIIICMVARLISDKGVREYLEASKILKNEYKSKVNFILLGDRDENNPTCLPYNILKSHLESGNLIHLGFRDDIANILKSCDIYCLPSYREGLPVSTLEAMATGLPIVTTDAVGCRDTVDEGINGVKVPIKNVGALVQALDSLIRDSSLRKKMGIKSREKAEKEFSLRKIVNEHLKIYQAVFDTCIQRPFSS